MNPKTSGRSGSRSVALLVVALLAAGAMERRVNPQDYTGGRQRDAAQRSQRNSSALAVMLGEFRTSLSDMMFIKTERYLHGGVGYAAHHDSELLSVEGTARGIEDHQAELSTQDADLPEGYTEDEDHAGTKTLIPSSQTDFRGIVGTFHREVKPWRDPSKPHIHTDGTQLLPWFKIMTLSDPNYIQGYTVGSFWLKRLDNEQADLFVEEGLKHNPEAFQIHLSKGHLKLNQSRDESMSASEVEALLREAEKAFTRAAELAIQQRPENFDLDQASSSTWGMYHENDALAACNLSALLAQRTDRPDVAHQRAEKYLATFPDNGVLKRLLEKHAP